MPLAKSLLKSYVDFRPAMTSYCHVYNKGIEGRIIFADPQDYETFRSFINEYLNPANPEGAKKTFTVHGRTFQGTPHMPKNYFGRIELVTFSLLPDHFHLILKENEEGSLESFIRSLCTRYSMYFNKKYTRTGSLFQGPYRLARLDGDDLVSKLSIYIKHDPKDADPDLPENIILDKLSSSLERRNLTTTSVPPKQVKTSHRIPEVSALFAVFITLVGLGLRNINASTVKNIADGEITSPEVLSESIAPTPSPLPSASPSAKGGFVVVNTPNQTTSVSIRMEPSAATTAIAKAKNGDFFEFIAYYDGWFEIKLPDGSNGFISRDVSYLDNTIY